MRLGEAGSRWPNGETPRLLDGIGGMNKKMKWWSLFFNSGDNFAVSHCGPWNVASHICRYTGCLSQILRGSWLSFFGPIIFGFSVEARKKSVHDLGLSAKQHLLLYSKFCITSSFVFFLSAYRAPRKPRRQRPARVYLVKRVVFTYTTQHSKSRLSK
ncbi:hypothetical protein QBC44DRAFT_74257 [Cladorrhinum sp. PSN332]|nr:hypothetical protein QBC44DRAFT_74257 [Cladorrhinum sp. PSN332]